MKKHVFLTILIFLFLAITFPLSAYAEDTPSEDVEIKYKAKIIEIEFEACPEDYGEGNCYFFTLEILDGSRKGENVESIAAESDDPKLSSLSYKVGQTVYLVETKIGDESQYYVKEPIRKNALLTITLLFVFFVVLIGGRQGISSLAGLVISILVIMIVIIPMMLSGTNPILASVFGSIVIMLFSIYLSHGLNKKTSIALLGTIISLILTSILAFTYTKIARLTGYSSDEATFLVQLIDKPINMQGVLLASLVIGGIGILDDITVSQVTTINELHKANPTLRTSELFKRSMVVGKDHIASMVNTLVLAYTGSALPLVMLFVASGAGFLEIINTELIAEEIVRTLVGSIGLILAVPITSVLACKIVSQTNEQPIRRRI